MKTVKFEGSNCLVLDAENTKNLPTPGYIVRGNEKHPVTLCYEMSDTEFKKISETRKIWMTVDTFNGIVPPVKLSADKPEMRTIGKLKGTAHPTIALKPK